MRPASRLVSPQPSSSHKPARPARGIRACSPRSRPASRAAPRPTGSKSHGGAASAACGSRIAPSRTGASAGSRCWRSGGTAIHHPHPLAAPLFGFACGGLMHLLADWPNPLGVPWIWRRHSLNLWKSGRCDLIVVAAAWGGTPGSRSRCARVHRCSSTGSAGSIAFDCNSTQFGTRSACRHPCNFPFVESAVTAPSEAESSIQVPGAHARRLAH